MDDHLKTIEALFRIAGSNNPNEAASALAHELLEGYSLDIAVIEQNRDGIHKYQRRLWEAIAQLNRCWYWAQKSRTHWLVGSKDNIMATKDMAIHLHSTIDRLCCEQLQENGKDPTKQFWSRWAVAYREGIADSVIEKLAARRPKERDAGAGQEERRAAARAEADRLRAEWAKAHPAEAHRQAAAARARDRARERREASRRPPEERRDSEAYAAGYSAGEKIEPQRRSDHG
jgi:hypothetical protein